MRVTLGYSKLLILGLVFALVMLTACQSSTVSGPPLPTSTPDTTLVPTITGDNEPSPRPVSPATSDAPQPSENTAPTPRTNPTTALFIPSINEGNVTSAPTEPLPTVEIQPTTPGGELIPASGQPTTLYLPAIQSQQDKPPFRFVTWGDTKTGTDMLAAISDQARQLNPAFTLYLGDLEEDGFTTSGTTAWTNAINGGNSNGLSAITFQIRGNHDNLDLPGWQAYFDAAGTSQRVGAQNFTVLEEDISYAFEYKNAVFIALDVLGNGDFPTANELAFLDSTLTAAEARGLEHAFIMMHGPIYHVSKHNNCAGRTCTTADPIASFVRVLNNHPIVSAVFNGHEHLNAYIHMDASRIPEIVTPWEQFITGAAGAELYPCDQDYRFDYCGGYDGFAAVDVSEKTFTVKIYQQGITTAIKTYTFTKD